MSDEQFRILSEKLDTLVRLTAINVFGGKTKTEAVGILTEYGFTQGEIASLLRTTVGSVKDMRHRLKQKVVASKGSSKGGGKSAEDK